MNSDPPLIPVLFADDCPPCECCGDPFCVRCQLHYADCGCPGPTQEGWQYVEVEGQLFAYEIDIEE